MRNLTKPSSALVQHVMELFNLLFESAHHTGLKFAIQYRFLFQLGQLVALAPASMHASFWENTKFPTCRPSSSPWTKTSDPSNPSAPPHECSTLEILTILASYSLSYMPMNSEMLHESIIPSSAATLPVACIPTQLVPSRHNARSAIGITTRYVKTGIYPSASYRSRCLLSRSCQVVEHLTK